MGIYDREYYRGGGTAIPGIGARSVVMTLIMINVIVYILQVLFQNPLTQLIGCRSMDLFEGFPQFWRLITANFAHGDMFHIFGNMLGLFIFGRELEEIYGKRNFLTLYFAGGVLAILAEAIVLQVDGRPTVQIIGASGAVLALAALYATLFPRRTILFMMIIPMQMWVLCVAFIAFDVLGFFGRANSNTAHMAHLAGAAFGFSYRYFDLRWERLLSKRRSRPRKKTRSAEQGPAEILRPFEPAPPPQPRSDPVSDRIDELLAKISEAGLESLNDEERSFLEANSQNYRSR